MKRRVTYRSLKALAPEWCAVLFLQAVLPRPLLPDHPAMPFPPDIESRIKQQDVGPPDHFVVHDTANAATRPCHSLTSRQRKPKLTPQIQNVFLCAVFPRHAYPPVTANAMAQLFGGREPEFFVQKARDWVAAAGAETGNIDRVLS